MNLMNEQMVESEEHRIGRFRGSTNPVKQLFYEKRKHVDSNFAPARDGRGFERAIARSGETGSYGTGSE